MTTRRSPLDQALDELAAARQGLQQLVRVGRERDQADRRRLARLERRLARIRTWRRRPN